MKGLKKLCTLILTGWMTVSSLTVVKAADNTSAAEAAKEGVVQVNTVFSDDDGTKHIICGGTGFIIGDSEETEYVVTCNHLINPDSETKNAAFEYLGISNEDDAWSKISISIEVVVEGDVVLSASVVNSSSELDLAVLQLPQPIYTRTPLTILSEENYDVDSLPYGLTDAVYALGYPDAIRYDSETQYYSSNQVIMTSGSIVNLVSLNGVQVIESDAAVDENNCGGPLVNENGYVIGMNLLTKDGMYACSLDSTKITKVLDGLGIQYTRINVDPNVEAEKEAQQQEELEAKAASENNSKNSTKLMIMICVGAVAIIAAIVTLVIVLVLRKDGAKKQKDNSKTNTSSLHVEESNRSIKMTSGNGLGQSLSNASDETTILNAGFFNDGETTLLSGELNNYKNMGTLVRKRTSEKISLNKNEFILGKDALHADYCIENNSSISRKHAVISSSMGGVILQDCNSTNGTFINGARLESGRSVVLNTGDIIKLANEEFEYQA